uniref:Uncharacterized protein n=1 Tax=Panagrolaimus superbus TaxID=310955 RepID=A0A914YDJ4_9BILA
MRQLDLFFFLLFIFAASNKFVESIESDPKTWTILKNGKTYVALHILPERINIAFPKQITFDRLASDLTIYSPVQECENTETLKFKLLFSKELYVRGIILSDISVLLYEKCDDEENPYNIVSVKDDGLKGLICF